MDNNYTSYTSEFQIAADIFKLAFEEYQTHHITRNYTGLIRRYYSWFEDEYGDPRVNNFLFMDNPLPAIGLVLSYLAWVLVIGPVFMRDRKPFNINSILVVYNAFQVALSAYMFYEHLMAGWLNYYSLKCQPVDYSDGPMSRRMLNLCYIYFISKLTEFADTTFFVLRKKKSQITWLHVYHHSLTPIEAWILVKFLAGGNATFPNLLNNFVHICMYFYYMMSAMGPTYSKYLWWKKYMTELQIAQFILCIVHCLRAMSSAQCRFSKIVSGLLLLNSTIFFFLFMNFYVHSYRQKSIASNSCKPSTPALSSNGIKDSKKVK